MTFKCNNCGKEAKIPCHKLNGDVLCYPCDKKEKDKFLDECSQVLRQK